MAKVQALEWKPFFQGELVMKGKPQLVIVTEDGKHPKGMPLRIAGFVVVTLSVAVAVATFPHLMHAAPAAVPTLAGTGIEELHKAVEPIKQLIFGFAHEIYFVMMAWGGLEALIGRFESGFRRMKTATLAYIILFWVPWIVRHVNGVVPTTGW